MFIPTQGFRHAATLLVTNRIRAIPVDASSETARLTLERLAHDLVALGDDMRAPAEASAWLIAEFNTTVDRLPHVFDRDDAKQVAAAILARVASRQSRVEPRDLFLVYVPEDRLPVAAPLAVELTKRRVSVAFADYEVATAQQFSDAIASGLNLHRGGVVLSTKAFERARWASHAPESDRLRIVRNPDHPSTATDLAEWATRLRLRDVAK